jgi:2-polyprenyl-3-methyl-5-hydroxy-6-metoxy-1,4-benzoquinol methylase
MMDAWSPELWAAWRRLVGSPVDRRPPAPPELARAAAAVHRLSAGLGGARTKAGRGYMDDPELLGAYLLHWWPISYLQACSALDLAGVPPRAGGRALDLGCGPGPASAALRDRGFEVVGLDHSARALDVRRALMPGPTAVWNGEADPVPAGPWDVVWLGHVINELFKRQSDRMARRVALLRQIGATLAPHGRVFLVEPAAHALNAELLALRDALIADGWFVHAPCFTQAPCPARTAGPQGTGVACHATARGALPAWTVRLGRAAHIDRAEPGYSLLVLGRTPPDARTGVRLRVVSEPMVNKAGRERRVVCGEAGRMSLSAPGRPSGAPEPWRAVWRGLVRGDGVEVADAEAREGGLGLAAGTALRRID